MLSITSSFLRKSTISQAIRSTGIRRSPYRGRQKTHLHHVQIAAGINVLRILTHLQAQTQGKPSRPERQATPFARLKEVAWLSRSDV